jgi:hypothetical protein
MMELARRSYPWKAGIILGSVQCISYLFQIVISSFPMMKYRHRPGELESSIISVFLRDGTFELGIGELMDKDRDSWQFDELEAGYIFDNKFAFIAYSSELFWVLDVSKRSWTKFPVPFETVGIRVLAGDDKTAYAIFDHRNLLRHYPDLPPFELAVFDLVSETSYKQDFAPVEAALTAAGFEMTEIKFQPSSTGKSSSATPTRPRSSNFPTRHSH